jgi:hypothetical protein
MKSLMNKCEYDLLWTNIGTSLFEEDEVLHEEMEELKRRYLIEDESCNLY